ncbi:MAG TPA: phosphatase PAP2 family protein [Ktedonobacteraceae bacterium]|nr:phosphatase PAP2 family protein [Ktedonobacteraceae bacterium]
MQQKNQDESQKERRKKGNIPAKEPLGERIEEDVEHIVEEAQEEVAAARKPWYQTRKWGIILLAIDIILLALFAFMAIWIAYHPVIAIDVAITRDFQANQSPWLRYTMIAVSYIGNVMILSVGLVALAAILFWILDLRLEAILIVVVYATSGILNGLIKLIVARPRPSASLVEIIQASSGNSFPSGHVMSYVAFWGLLFSFSIILFRGKHWWRTALLIISALFVVLVGPSRIYLGDHWASDVLGAYFIGFIWLAMSLWLYLYVKGRGVLAPRDKRARHFHRKYVRRPE